ncbi:MAG: calcium-binding protein, partial [Hyphomicrobiaceae bacterium]
MADIHISWSSIIDIFATATTATTTSFVVPNSDGNTSTQFQGSSFTYDPSTGFLTGGTITSISLIVNVAGNPVLTTLTNLSVSAAQLGGFVTSVQTYQNQFPWLGIVDQEAEALLFSPTEIRLANTDGTFTVVHGSGFSEAGGVLSGTIDYVDRVASNGTTVLQTFGTPGAGPDDVPLAIGASALFPDVAGEQFYMLMNQGNNTLTGVTGGIAVGGDLIYTTLDDGPGNDNIIGNLNNSFLSYDLATSAVQVNLLTGSATGGGGNDTLSGVTGVSGSEFDDTITGDDTNFDGFGLGNSLFGMDGNDTIFGGGANDTISGGQGDDSLDGGTGLDWADYGNEWELAGGVTVSLAIAGAQNTGGAGTDILANFENLRGTVLADSLTGSGIANILRGEGGNDSLVGGAGNDTLEGGDGADNMVGNQDNDFINAGAGDDYAHGGGGNDTLIGDSGNDRLDGGLGADTINGGLGADILIANQDNDSITGGSDGDYMHGGQGNDTVQGNDGNDVLLGGVGSDSIDGGAGHDGAAWSGLRSAYTVTNNGGGSWTVLHIATGDTDAVTGVEFLVFDDQIV